MVVLIEATHTHVKRGDAQVAKQLNFPPDVEDFIHELIFKALQRKAKQEASEQNAEGGVLPACQEGGCDKQAEVSV